MKLKFLKKENDEIYIMIGEKEFSSNDYVDMIKEIYSNEKVEVEFSSDITSEEQESVNFMIAEINKINVKSDVSEDEDIL
ncbi:MAG: hypothetical protein RLY49_84 [Candidatus Parcubacteria bacterium]|jgi:hypothetical protein